MNFVNTFQKIGLTIAAIIFSCAALFYAINPVKADNPTLTNSTGKYMMDKMPLYLKILIIIFLFGIRKQGNQNYTDFPTVVGQTI
jgi:hypothetical protein